MTDLMSQLLEGRREMGPAGAKNLEIIEKSFFLPRNPLKRLKTAKGIFGKACRIQAESLEKLGVGLEKFGELRGACLRL
jgi:hypothetical protein